MQKSYRTTQVPFVTNDIFVFQDLAWPQSALVVCCINVGGDNLIKNVEIFMWCCFICNTTLDDIELVVLLVVLFLIQDQLKQIETTANWPQWVITANVNMPCLGFNPDFTKQIR